jgi:hypothetical protein
MNHVSDTACLQSCPTLISSLHTAYGTIDSFPALPLCALHILIVFYLSCLSSFPSALI